MFIEYIKKYEKSSVLINIIMIIVSILLIINPAGILNLVMNIFGLVIIVDGIFRIISYFKSDREEKAFSGELFSGIVITIVGILVLVCKTYLISLLPVIIGIWITVRSIMKLQIAFNLKNANSDKWIGFLISSVISILLGILIIANPFGTIVTVTIMTGIVLLVSSIIDLLQNLAIIMVL